MANRKIKIPSQPLQTVHRHHIFPAGTRTPSYTCATIPPYNHTCPEEPTVECIIRPEAMDKLLEIPGFPYPLAAPNPPRYEIKPIPGAGLGVVATTDLDIGDDIIVERPLLLNSLTLWPLGNLPHPNKFMRVLVERMSHDDAEDFFALNNCKGYSVPHIQGIVDTNSIGLGPLPGYDGECVGVCKTISRVNHSCSPNSVWKFDIKSFAVHLRAALPIKKGEEITISYGTGHLPQAHRQKMLLQIYKFRCSCLPCLSPNPNESDDARLMVESVTMANKCGDDSALRNWLTDATKADDLILVECTYFIRTLDRERYYNHCVWVVWYQRLVKAYCALEDEENARKWASKAAKLHKAYALTDGGWDAVAKDPRSTDWWGLRVKNGVRIVPNLDSVNVEKGIAPTDELRPGDQVVTTIQGSRL